MSARGEFGTSVKSVGILMVATNAYLERWKETALDLEQNAFKKVAKVVIHLFTNEIEAAAQFSKDNLKRIEVRIHRIPGWGWPEATLLRYEFISQIKNVLSHEFLVYLDSDMRVTGDIADIVLKLDVSDGLGVVSHPGFFRPSGIGRVKLYIMSPKSLLADFKNALLNSKHLGAWEKNDQSTAFVPRRGRKSYVHGAIWFGYKEDFISMCQTLTSQTRIDLNNNIIARWHDESHLNCYITKNPHKIFNNRLSWVMGYKNLCQFDSSYLVSNVQKHSGEGRTPSNA